MKVYDIQNKVLRSEAVLFVANLRALASLVENDWSRHNIRQASSWFGIAAERFKELDADHHWTADVFSS